MSDVALYYPYLYFQDEGWLRTAVLFWPRIGRIVPSGFPPHDTAGVRALVDNDLVFNVAPDKWTLKVGLEFIRLIQLHSADLEHRYRLPRTLVAQGRVDLGTGDRPSLEAPYVELDDVDLRTLGWMNIGRMPSILREELHGRGLAVIGEGPTGIWIGVHPKLSTVYKCALADRIARANHMQAITEGTREHVVLNGWDLDTLARVLLADDEPGMTPSPNDIAEVFALAALQMVVPAELDRVPIRQVLDVRSALQPEFVRFREFVSSLHGHFAEISATEDQHIRARKLEVLAEDVIEPQLRTLERVIRQARLEPVRAVMSMKSLTLPAVAEVMAHQVGLPPGVSATGAVALTLLASATATRDSVHELRTQSPVGYLLGLKKELTPSVVARTAAALFRRANPSRPDAGHRIHR